MNQAFPTPVAPDPVSTVAASDLVRQFGLWQERAARAPVYVLYRGRPRFVLASIDTMEALCAPHAADGVGSAERDAVLDAMHEMVVLLDSDRRVRAASRPARAYLRVGAAFGHALEELVGPAAARLVDAGAARIEASGIGETLECLSRRGRRIRIVIAPSATGMIATIDDISREADLARARAARLAIDTALGVSDLAARVDINPRGYLISPSASLARLSGSAPSAHCSVRFVSMFEVGSRVALGNAIETVFDTPDPVALDADLLTRDGGHRPVRIGLEAVRHGAHPEAVTAILVAAGTP